jgi:O-antigen ligase
MHVSCSHMGIEEFRASVSSVMLPLFVLCMGTSFVMSIVAPLGLVLPAMALLGAALMSTSAKWEHWKGRISPELSLILVFSGWSFLCALWSQNAVYGLYQVTVLGFALLPLLLIQAWKLYSYEQRFEAMRVLTWLYILFLFLLGLALMKGLSLLEFRGLKMKYNLWPMNRAALFAALLLPLFCYATSIMRAPRLLFAGLALLAILMVFASHSETAKLVLAIALPLYLLARYARRWFVPMALFTIVVAFLAFPFVIKPLVDYLKSTAIWLDNEGAAESRALLWVALADLPLRAPLTGLGVEFVRFHQFVHPLPNGPTSELHPHTILLQLWIDLGLIGVGLVLAFLARLLMFSEGVKKRGGELRIVFILSVLTVFAVSHGMWQAWFIAVAALCASMLLMVLDVVASSPSEISQPSTVSSEGSLLRDMDWFFWPVSFTLLAVLLVMGRQQFSGVIDLSAWRLAPGFLAASVSTFVAVHLLRGKGIISGVWPSVLFFVIVATMISVLLNFFSGIDTVIPRSVPLGLIIIFPIFAVPLASKSIEISRQSHLGASH